MKEIISNLWDWNYLISFFSSAIESFPVLWIIFPWQNLLLIVWWFFWEINSYNLIWVILTASLWAIAWNWIWYILWVKYWDSFFEKYGIWFWIWTTEVKYLKSWIDKWWVWWITFWKFHPLTRAFLPFIAWSMWMKKTSFAIYNVIGSIVRASTIIIMWVFFAKYYEILLDYAWYIMLVIMWLIWIYIYYFKKEEFKQYLKEKEAEIDNIIDKKK
jgi:membrane protein DedA with SNARE-associated domain